MHLNFLAHKSNLELIIFSNISITTIQKNPKSQRTEPIFSRVCARTYFFQEDKFALIVPPP